MEMEKEKEKLRKREKDKKEKKEKESMSGKLRSSTHIPTIHYTPMRMQPHNATQHHLDT
jgi:hypothetical protein